MVDFLKKFDLLGREPRQIQIDALNWITENWSSKVLAIQAPTGTGKSAIARAIQHETAADIVTPTNQLMSQYSDIYPVVNTLKGKSHYDCSNVGSNCLDGFELNKRYCDGCPYRACKEKAVDEPTFFNPNSLFFFNVHDSDATHPVLIIDEAHKLKDIMVGMAGKSFNNRKWDLPRSLADLRIDGWLGSQLVKLKAQAKDIKDLKILSEIEAEYRTIEYIRRGYQENPENYAIELQTNRDRTKSLIIQPIVPPEFIRRTLLRCDKLILMSATLSKFDIAEILGHNDFKYLDLDSPIPKENRQVIYAPAPFPMNTKTSPKDIANEINKVVAKHKELNTIVHVTYAMSASIRPYLDFPHIFNTPDDKEAKIRQFKTSGGVFIASGCAEGLDLPDDQCRLNIIPVLSRLNIGDPVVKKRMSKADGQTWYRYQTLMTTIQQIGRSTRSLTDWSISYILDPDFPRLMMDKSLQIPKSFKECIEWKNQKS